MDMMYWPMWVFKAALCAAVPLVFVAGFLCGRITRRPKA